MPNYDVFISYLYRDSDSRWNLSWSQTLESLGIPVYEDSSPNADGLNILAAPSNAGNDWDR